MWIKNREYERLKDREEMCTQLLLEVQRLSNLITEKTEDCNIGPWCKGCIHRGVDESVIYFPHSPLLGNLYVKETAGRVEYCKKHLHELCPEFEMKG